LTLDSGNKRGTLEQSTSEGLHSLSQLLLVVKSIMKTENANVLFTSTLLGLDKTSSTINADDQTSSNLGIEGTTVTGFLDTKNTTNPSDDFVRRGVCRLQWAEECI
jgi:hypothetical protein